MEACAEPDIVSENQKLESFTDTDCLRFEIWKLTSI